VTRDEIAEHCRQQQQLLGCEDAPVCFLIPGRLGKRTTRRLWPGGPKGEIVQDDMDGRGLRVMFKADEVLAALEKVTSSES